MSSNQQKIKNDEYIASSSSILSNNSCNNDTWTVHVETIPPLPDETFYLKNVYGEQTVEDFKRIVCQIMNRKIQKTYFFHEGEMMDNENTLSHYNKLSDDVCIQHAYAHGSKNVLIRWINAIN